MRAFAHLLPGSSQPLNPLRIIGKLLLCVVFSHETFLIPEVILADGRRINHLKRANSERTFNTFEFLLPNFNLGSVITSPNLPWENVAIFDISSCANWGCLHHLLASSLHLSTHSFTFFSPFPKPRPSFFFRLCSHLELGACFPIPNPILGFLHYSLFPTIKKRVNKERKGRKAN